MNRSFSISRRQLSRMVAASAIGNIGLVRAQDAPLVLGQSAAFSGPAMQLGTQFHAGAKLYFDQINARGGVGGRRVEIRHLDDGYEPDRCVANTEKLIKGEVFALFGYIGTPTSLAALPLASAARVPFIAPFTGAMGLREPFKREAFHLRASYDDETALIVKQLTELHQNRIAVFYQNDSYGKAGLSGVTKALAARQLKPVAEATVERNSEDVRAAVAQLAKSGAQAIVQIGAYKACAAFIQQAKKPATAASSTTCLSSARRRWPMSWARTARAWWCRRWCPRPTTRRARSRASSLRQRSKVRCSPTFPAWKVIWRPSCSAKGCGVQVPGPRVRR